MRRVIGVRRSSRERYKELAAGLLAATVSEGLQLILPNVINLVPVLLIVGAVAPIADDILSFLAGFVIVSVALAAFGTVSLGLSAFDLVFAIAATLAAFYTRRGFRKGTYERNYVLSAAVIAVVLVAAYAFLGYGGSLPSAASSTATTTLNATSTLATTATTSVLTTTIMTYSGCSTYELDQPFRCRDPALSAPANLSFTLSSTDQNDTLYSIDLACTNTFNLTAPSSYDSYYLQANGTFSQGNPGTSITASSPIHAAGLPCYGVGRSPISFNGILWVQYHPGSYATPLQTAHIEVYYNLTSMPSLSHVNSSA